MINTIIYTKDRASQLNLLLDSLNKNATGIFKIAVLYKASNNSFLDGYKKLQSKNVIEGITWVEETNFKKQNIELLKTDLEYTCFFTDDDIVYQPINENEIISLMEEDDEVFCFSLRLGKNTTYCYTQNCNNVLIPLEENDKFVKWDWTKHYMDFGYPLSVDGHIFKTNDIANLSNKVSYVNPNTFEAALQIFDSFPKEKMAAYINNKLVNSPSNVVQSVYPNRKGEQFGISVELLNKMYLEGDCIDLNKIIFADIRGCHQELKLEFTNMTDIEYLKH